MGVQPIYISIRILYSIIVLGMAMTQSTSIVEIKVKTSRNLPVLKIIKEYDVEVQLQDYNNIIFSNIFFCSVECSQKVSWQYPYSPDIACRKLKIGQLPPQQ